MTVVDRAARAAVRTRGLVLVDPRARVGRADLDRLRRGFADHDVEVCEPFLLAARTHEAVREGRPFVGIAGGDDTIRGVAEILAHTPVALLPVPLGPLNHFARALGIDSLDDAILAAKVGHIELADAARVGDRVFVNRSSIGAYPGLATQRNTTARRMPKRIAGVVAALEQLRAGKRIAIDIDGRASRVWLVVVGNGCYGEGLVNVTTRESLRDGVLDVRIVRADGRLAGVRLLLAALRGEVASPTAFERRTCCTITLGVRRRTRVDVALDGDVENLPAPLNYEILPGALRVVVPDLRG